MLNLVIGLFVGVFLGIVIMCILSVAKGENTPPNFQSGL